MLLHGTIQPMKPWERRRLDCQCGRDVRAPIYEGVNNRTNRVGYQLFGDNWQKQFFSPDVGFFNH